MKIFQYELKKDFILSISHQKNDILCKHSVSYLVDLGGGKAVEWAPDGGPFTLLEQGRVDHPDSVTHWYLGRCTGYGNWGQMAVDETGILQHLEDGDLDRVYIILKEWGTR